MAPFVLPREVVRGGLSIAMQAGAGPSDGTNEKGGGGRDQSKICQRHTAAQKPGAAPGDGRPLRHLRRTARADQMIYQCDQTVSELGDKISADEKGQIETAKTKLQDAMKGTDTDAIKAATEELTKVFYDISSKLYQQANPQGGAADAGQQAGGAAGNGGAQGGDGQDYYDADYQVVDDDKK